MQIADKVRPVSQIEVKLKSNSYQLFKLLWEVTLIDKFRTPITARRKNSWAFVFAKSPWTVIMLQIQQKQCISPWYKHKFKLHKLVSCIIYYSFFIFNRLRTWSMEKIVVM